MKNKLFFGFLILLFSFALLMQNNFLVVSAKSNYPNCANNHLFDEHNTIGNLDYINKGETADTNGEPIEIVEDDENDEGITLLREDNGIKYQ